MWPHSRKLIKTGAADGCGGKEEEGGGGGVYRDEATAGRFSQPPAGVLLTPVAPRMPVLCGTCYLSCNRFLQASLLTGRVTGL